MVAFSMPFLMSCQEKKKTEVREIPMEDFFRTPDKSGFSLSPSGEYLSFMAPYETRQNIFVQKVGEENAVRITSETERGIAGHFWANDNTIVYIKDVGGDENYQLFGIAPDGTNERAYTDMPGVRSQVIDALTRVE